MAPTSLESLPGEILARIATSGSAESVITLTRTCRTLYRICYDTLVFKALIESQRSLWEDAVMLKVPTLSRYINSTDTLAWARFALADQRAMELYKATGTTDGALVMDSSYSHNEYEKWLPHLFVGRFPVDEIARSEYACIRIEVNADLQSLRQSIKELGAFAFVLRRAMSDRPFNPWTQPGFERADSISVPSALNIPMLPIDSSYQLPVPFHHIHMDQCMVEDSWTAWLHRHVARMSEPEFLMAGQWCGYYDYNSPTRFDGPMVAIQFTVDPSRWTRASDKSRKIRAQGRDSVGRFTLEGVVFFDGRLDLRKTYIGAHWFDWKCFMTPFGIFGYWGTRDIHRFRRHGILWLWKHEWNRQ